MVYLDNHATTPVDPRVVRAMEPFWTAEYGNPHSSGHRWGRAAFDAVEFARGQLADAINADVDEIYFTSGATESCNLAIHGVHCAHGRERLGTVAVSAIEHSAVCAPASAFGLEGGASRVLPVDQDGIVQTHKLQAPDAGKPSLISVMLVNNEIGTIQPISDLSDRAKQLGYLVHTDASQALGRVEIDVDELGVDLLTLSAHKAYGPKGIGALYVRGGIRNRISPITHGGGQEKGLRPGTLPVSLIVGFGEAAEIAEQELANDCARILEYRNSLESSLRQLVPNTKLVGSRDSRVAGNLAVCLPGYRAEEIVAAVGERVAVSAGSACTETGVSESRVLAALGIVSDEASSTIRFGIGRFNKLPELQSVVDVFKGVLREGENA